MESEVKWVYERISLYFELAEHPDWSNRHLANELDKSEKWVRKWRKRIAAAEPVSVSTFLSHSSAPKTCAKQVAPEVKALIGDLRGELSEKFHRKAGADTILYELRKREDLK